MTSQAVCRVCEAYVALTDIRSACGDISSETDDRMGQLEAIVETGEAVSRADVLAKACWIRDQVAIGIPISEVLAETLVAGFNRLITLPGRGV